MTTNTEFSIMEQYDPALHTGGLRIKTHRVCVNNDGWVEQKHTVLLMRHEGEPDKVADFATREAAEQFVEICKAEITLSKGFA